MAEVMGDKGSHDRCRILHADYREVTIRVIVPRDLSIEEVADAMRRCLADYVKRNSRVGLKDYIYVETDCA